MKLISPLYLILGLGFMSCHERTGILRHELKERINRSYYVPEEKTLYGFYELSDNTAFHAKGALRYQLSTDLKGEWHDLDQAKFVQIHEQAQCGESLVCGSFSLKQEYPLSSVKLRYYYFAKNSSDFDEFELSHTNMLENEHVFRVYGHFAKDERSTRWVGNHDFPRLEESEVERLGLRRSFELVRAQASNQEDRKWLNPFTSLYGVDSEEDCAPNKSAYVALDLNGERGKNFWLRPGPAVIQETRFPYVCAIVRLSGTAKSVEHVAIARKNPRVRVHSVDLGQHVGEVTPINLVISKPDDEHSEFLEFQIAQLQMGHSYQKINIEDAQLDQTVTQAITSQILPDHNYYVRIVYHVGKKAPKSKKDILDQSLRSLKARFPQIRGYLVYDREFRNTLDDREASSTIWCNLDPELERNKYFQSCLLTNGLKIESRQLFPDERRYQAYLDNPNLDKKPKVIEAMSVHAPFVSANVREYPVEIIGAPPEMPRFEMGTFHVEKVLRLEPKHRLSYCRAHDSLGNLAFIGTKVAEPGTEAQQIVAGISELGKFHQINLRDDPADYTLGLKWRVPLLVKMDTEFEIDVPKLVKFVFKLPDSVSVGEKIGENLWGHSEFNTGQALTVCEHFCDHPPFSDNGRIYHFEQNWSEMYEQNCYDPNQIPDPVF